METQQILSNLVDRFDKEIDLYKKGNSFNEQMTRQQYIDVLLKLLGWDISNPKGLSYNEREITVEEFLMGNKQDRPDYTIRMNGVSLFHIEAKKVGVDIFHNPTPAIQARRYGWNSNHKISVLTNFEYLVIYQTYEMPSDGDSASTFRYKCYHYSEYIEKFEEIYELLSKESVLKGVFESWTNKITPDNATKLSLDNVFLNQLNEWRVLIAEDLYSKNIGFGNDITLLNEIVQTFLNQIIFLRFAEDNNYETKDLLKNEILKHQDYYSYFKCLDKKYNAGLFKNATVISNIDKSILSLIVEELYFPRSSYDFSVIDLSILSKVYENFLQKEIVIVDSKVVLCNTRNASIKAVVSTPNDLVIAMVKNVLGKKLMGKSPEEILELRIADLAVGSGIFLIEAYNYIEDYLIHWFAQKNSVTPNSYLVPFYLKKAIIQNVLVGFDINNLAVQLTRFSLLLRILSFDNNDRVKEVIPILPSLENNIICRNSLISESFIDFENITDDCLLNLCPQEEDLFNKKYDVIIGNPPYLSTEDIKKVSSDEEIKIYKQQYQSSFKQYDKYFLFVEKSLEAIKDDGDVILLIPNKFITVGAAEKLRGIIAKNKFIKKIFDFRYTQIFKTSTIYVAVVHFSKSDILEYVEVGSFKEVYEDKNGIEYGVSNLNHLHWFLTNDEELKNQYYYAVDNFPKIDTEIIPQNGIQTSCNKVYVLEKNKLNETDEYFETECKGIKYNLEKSILKEFYQPKNAVHGGSYNNIKADKVIIFPYKNGKIIEEDVLKKNYPGVYSYLVANKEELLPKEFGGMRDVRGSDKNILWYQYGRAQSLKEVEREKIIVGVMSDRPNFNIDKDNLVIASGGTAGYIGLSKREGSPYSLEYIQAWLSHNFTDRIFQTIGSSFEGEFYSHGTALYKDIPLLPIDFTKSGEVEIHDRITKLVQEVSNCNNNIEHSASENEKRIFNLKKSNLIKLINNELDDLLIIKMEEK